MRPHNLLCRNVSYINTVRGSHGRVVDPVNANCVRWPVVGCKFGSHDWPPIEPQLLLVLLAVARLLFCIPSYLWIVHSENRTSHSLVKREQWLVGTLKTCRRTETNSLAYWFLTNDDDSRHKGYNMELAAGNIVDIIDGNTTFHVREAVSETLHKYIARGRFRFYPSLQAT